jgi:hypothetical protein
MNAPVFFAGVSPGFTVPRRITPAAASPLILTQRGHDSFVNVIIPVP